jgi:hypothetical protein
MELRDFNPAIKYGAKLTGTSLDEGHLLVGNTSDEAAEIELSGDVTMDSTGSVTLSRTGSLAQGLPFIVAGTSLGTLALNTGTAWVDGISAANTYGLTPYITGISISNTGDNACDGGSALLIMDAAGVTIWSIAYTGLHAGTTLTLSGTPYVLAHQTDLAGTAGNAVGFKSSGSLTGTPVLVGSFWGILK